LSRRLGGLFSVSSLIEYLREFVQWILRLFCFLRELKYKELLSQLFLYYNETKISGVRHLPTTRHMGIFSNDNNYCVQKIHAPILEVVP